MTPADGRITAEIIKLDRGNGEIWPTSFSLFYKMENTDSHSTEEENMLQYLDLPPGKLLLQEINAN